MISSEDCEYEEEAVKQEQGVESPTADASCSMSVLVDFPIFALKFLTRELVRRSH